MRTTGIGFIVVAAGFIFSIKNAHSVQSHSTVSFEKGFINSYTKSQTLLIAYYSAGIVLLTLTHWMVTISLGGWGIDI